MKMFLSITLSLLAIAFFSKPSHALTGAGGENFVSEYVYDFAKLGGATGFISLTGNGKANPLPSGAVVEEGYFLVEDAFLSTASSTIALGDAGSGTRYQNALQFNNGGFTENAPIALATGMPNLIESVNEANVGITIGTDNLTAGKIRVVIKGHVPRGN
jgi:hypothetical protein